MAHDSLPLLKEVASTVRVLILRHRSVAGLRHLDYLAFHSLIIDGNNNGLLRSAYAANHCIQTEPRPAQRSWWSSYAPGGPDCGSVLGAAEEAAGPKATLEQAVPGKVSAD